MTIWDDNTLGACRQKNRTGNPLRLESDSIHTNQPFGFLATQYLYVRLPDGWDMPLRLIAVDVFTHYCVSREMAFSGT